MALEPRTIARDEANEELISMTRRFKIGLVLTIPLVLLAMSDFHFADAMKAAVPLLISLVMLPLVGCPRKSAQRAPSNTSTKEISRERAIEIARPHVKFQPKSINAEKTTENRRPVWRVTFRGEPVGQVNTMGEIMIISIDRLTGEVVSVAQS
jgi:hypothetical protein